MFGLGKLLYFLLLSVNGIAVLSEDRFLNRIGWGATSNNNAQYQQFTPAVDSGEGQSIKGNLINLISAVRTLLRWPLILVNILIIIYELILG
ncbi:uncharacterized protein PRCAT00001243001 [Priceomyces carsonii]|uniref:uncharacterized protein n=1 Tax=Priceomyces carsonii TaxID=28549 RepID=UPI002EDA208D|nr:unnamed protein product [Priceomyces carsonii]